jgi:hypothetical protein
MILAIWLVFFGGKEVGGEKYITFQKKSESMKAKFFLLLILGVWFSVTDCGAQTPGWQWAKVAGSNHGEDVNGSCIDSQNNLYITGYYSGDEITFGDTTLNHYNGSEGWGSFFLTKYDSYGNVIWAKTAGGGCS